MRCISTPVLRCTLALLLTMAIPVAPARTDDAALPFADPIFDIDAIRNQPLDLKVLSEEIRDGLVIRKFEITSDVQRDDAGQPVPTRIWGLLLMPEQGAKLPGLLWCQGGMAPADTGIPGIYARKGYACIAITIPIDRTESWSAWDAANPKQANLTRYGVMQMRAITALCLEPRVDASRIGVAGASYGGFFATLVAGADPRVKAGASFFTGGYHNMGSNLPQFGKMPNQAAVDVWMKTIDPAWRHQQRDVPFLWTLPTNDNWFYFPAVARTFEQARTTRKALCIVPSWTHGFPPNVDQQIFDWLDVHLTGTRQPYIQPSKLEIRPTDEGLVATWASDGAPIKRAELVVSPNAPAAGDSPWLGQWVHRLHQPFPAVLDDARKVATATIPVLDPTRPMLVYGNLIDEHDVVTSTLPVLLAPPHPQHSPRGAGQWRGCPWGELDPQDVTQLIGMAQPPGVADEAVHHRGTGSVRVEPAKNSRNPQARKRPTAMKLFHVPHLKHRLTLAVRSEAGVKVRVMIEAQPPANWQQPAVQAVMGTQPPALAKPAIVAETTVATTAEWQVVTLDVPAPMMAIEGYDLKLEATEPEDAVWWFDSVTFEPVVE